MTTVTLQQALETAAQLQRTGRIDEAERIYRQILTQTPTCADAMHLLGVAHAQRGQFEQGIEWIRQAIAIQPGSARIWSNLGRVLTDAKRLTEAVEAYRRIAELQPLEAMAHNDLATALFLAGRYDQAIAEYRAAIQLRDDIPGIWSNLANVLSQVRQFPEALKCSEKALAIQPDLPAAMGVRGTVLCEMGLLDEGIEQLRKAKALRPEMVELYNNIAGALHQRGKTQEALAELDQALLLQPKYARALTNRAKILRDKGRLPEAAEAIGKVLAIEPDNAEAHQNLATVLLDSGKIDQAIQSARRAAELAPGLADAHNVLANALKEDGQISAAIECFKRAVACKPDDAAIHSNLIYAMEFDPACDAATLLREQRRWNQMHAASPKRFDAPRALDRPLDRKLRIGYLSAHFFHHSEAFFMLPLLESHDHAQFEIHCYSDVARPDEITQRFRRCTDTWHDCQGRTDAEVAEQIHRDGIDILIDLTMHMGRNRALAVARKPATIQVAWLAYPGGTGMDAMDFRITDARIDPPGMNESCYAERSIRLPNCWCCYDPLTDTAASGERADGPIRFGSLNNPCKLNDPLLRLWAKVMQATPDSRLIVQAVGEDHRRRISELLQSLGINSDRLELVGRCSRSQYLRLYDRIDICLDPLPYNGITTTCDALWMGVPVVTLTGKTAAGRAAASILATAGLEEFVADNEQQFVHLVTALASDTARLADLRANLRGRFTQSLMMDGPHFARDMEAAYRQMWREGKLEIRNPNDESNLKSE